MIPFELKILTFILSLIVVPLTLMYIFQALEDLIEWVFGFPIWNYRHITVPIYLLLWLFLMYPKLFWVFYRGLITVYLYLKKFFLK